MCYGQSVLFPTSVAATHVQACSESSVHNRYAGYRITSAFTVTGVEGRTDDVTLAICTSSSDDDRANAVWVSIAPSDSTGNSIIQAGRVKCLLPAGSILCNGTNKVFWAWGRERGSAGCFDFTNVAPTGQLLGSWSSGTDVWRVTRDGNNWNIARDGGIVDNIPASFICWNLGNAWRQWEAESWDFGDALGGDLAVKYDLDQAHFRTSNGIWHTAGFTSPCNTVSSPPGKCSVSTNTKIRIWAEH